jgi:branched-chain amino acid transport system permease protein
MSFKNFRNDTYGVVGIILLLFLAPLFMKSSYWLHVLSVAGINVILVASLHTIYSTGEISLGTAGFMALGGYGSALLSMKLGVPVWFSMLLGGLMCALLALVLGYPFMRAKGVYFSILTLLSGEILRLIAWYSRGLTGGQVGLSKIPPPPPIKIPWSGTIVFDNKTSYYYLILIVVLICLFILYRLQKSQTGFTWRTIRERDDLAASVGINVLWYKIFAFVVGCFFVGIAGALFAHFMRLLAADASGKFGMFTSIYVLIYMVVGGESKFGGPILGAVFLTILPEMFRPLVEYRPIIFGALVILIVFLMRGGLVELPQHAISWFNRMRAVLGKT